MEQFHETVYMEHFEWENVYMEPSWWKCIHINNLIKMVPDKLSPKWVHINSLTKMLLPYISWINNLILVRLFMVPWNCSTFHERLPYKQSHQNDYINSLTKMVPFWVRLFIWNHFDEICLYGINSHFDETVYINNLILVPYTDIKMVPYGSPYKHFGETVYMENGSILSSCKQWVTLISYKQSHQNLYGSN